MITRNKVYKRLNRVFQDVFDDDSITVDDNTVASDVDGWDSLEHINLMVAIEDEFGIHFNMGEVNTTKNVGELVDIIMEKLN